MNNLVLQESNNRNLDIKNIRQDRSLRIQTELQLRAIESRRSFVHSIREQYNLVGDAERKRQFLLKRYTIKK